MHYLQEVLNWILAIIDRLGPGWEEASLREWRGQGPFRQPVPGPGLDCGKDCPASLDAYLLQSLV